MCCLQTIGWKLPCHNSPFLFLFPKFSVPSDDLSSDDLQFFSSFVLSCLTIPCSCAYQVVFDPFLLVS